MSKVQWFWCEQHGDFGVKPLCPSCEHEGRAFFAPEPLAIDEPASDDPIRLLVSLKAKRAALDKLIDALGVAIQLGCFIKQPESVGAVDPDAGISTK